MSSYTVEGILFSLQSDPAFLEDFNADAEALLAGYPLTAQERQDILHWNVRALSERGVSDMLLMVAFTAVNGQKAMPEYLRRQNA